MQLFAHGYLSVVTSDLGEHPLAPKRPWKEQIQWPTNSLKSFSTWRKRSSSLKNSLKKRGTIRWKTVFVVGWWVLPLMDDISHLAAVMSHPILSSPCLFSPLMETRQLTRKSSSGWLTSQRSAGRLKVHPLAFLPPVCVRACLCVRVCVCVSRPACLHPMTCYIAGALANLTLWP